jgi:hypothetical protein
MAMGQSPHTQWWDWTPCMSAYHCSPARVFRTIFRSKAHLESCSGPYQYKSRQNNQVPVPRMTRVQSVCMPNGVATN